MNKSINDINNNEASNDETIKPVSISFFNLLNQIYKTNSISALDEYPVENGFIQNTLPLLLPPQEGDILNLKEKDLNDLYESKVIERKPRNVETDAAVEKEVKAWGKRILHQYIEYYKVPAKDPIIATSLGALEENRLGVRSFAKNSLENVLNVETLPAHSAAGGIGLAQLVENAYFLDPASRPNTEAATANVGLFNKFKAKTPVPNAQRKAMSSSSISILPSRIFLFETSDRYAIATPLMPQEDMELYHKYTSKEFMKKYPQLSDFIKNIKNTITRISYFNNYDLFSVFDQAKQKVVPNPRYLKADTMKENAKGYQGSEVFDRILSIKYHNEALVKYRSSSFNTPLFFLPESDSIYQVMKYPDINKYQKVSYILTIEVKAFRMVLEEMQQDIITDNLLKDAPRVKDFVLEQKGLAKTLDELNAKQKYLESANINDSATLEKEWAESNVLIARGKQHAININNIRIESVRKIFGDFGPNVRFGYIDQNSPQSAEHQIITLQDNESKQWSFEWKNGKYQPISFVENDYMQYYLRKKYNLKEINTKTETGKIKVLLGTKVLYEGENLEDLQNNESFKKFRNPENILYTFGVLDNRLDVLFSDYGKDTLAAKPNLYFDVIAKIKDDPAKLEEFTKNIPAFLHDKHYDNMLINNLIGRVDIPLAELTKENVNYILKVSSDDIKKIEVNQKFMDRDLGAKLLSQKYNTDFHTNFLKQIAGTYPDEFLVSFFNANVEIDFFVKRPFLTSEIFSEAIKKASFQNPKYFKALFEQLQDSKFYASKIELLKRIQDPLEFLTIATSNITFVKDNQAKLNEVCRDKLSVEIKIDKNNNAYLEDDISTYLIEDFIAKLKPCSVGRVARSAGLACVTSTDKNVMEETNKIIEEELKITPEPKSHTNVKSPTRYKLQALHDTSEGFNSAMFLYNILKDAKNNDWSSVTGMAAPIAFNGIAGNTLLSIANKEASLSGKVIRVAAVSALSEVINNGMTIYDLYQNIKALQGEGLTEAEKQDLVVNIVADSGILTISLTSTAGMFAGLEYSGPIGTAATAVVLAALQGYKTEELVKKAGELVNLTGWEKFTEGIEAFFTGDVSNDLKERELFASAFSSYVNNFLQQQQSFIEGNKCNTIAFSSPDIELTDKTTVNRVHECEPASPHSPGGCSWSDSYETKKSAAPIETNRPKRIFLGDMNNRDDLPDELVVPISNQNFSTFCKPELTPQRQEAIEIENSNNKKRRRIHYHKEKKLDEFVDKFEEIAAQNKTSACQNTFIVERKEGENNCIILDGNNLNRVELKDPHKTLIVHIKGSQEAQKPSSLYVKGPLNSKTYASVNGNARSFIDAPGGGLIDLSGMQNAKECKLLEGRNICSPLFIDGFEGIIGRKNLPNTFNIGNSTITFIKTNGGGNKIDVNENSSLKHIQVEGGDVIDVKTTQAPLIEIIENNLGKPIEINFNNKTESVNLKVPGSINKDYFFNTEGLNFYAGTTPVNIKGIKPEAKIMLESEDCKFFPSTRHTWIGNRGDILLKPSTEGDTLETCMARSEKQIVDNFETTVSCAFESGENAGYLVVSNADSATINPADVNYKKLHVYIKADNNVVVIKEGINYTIEAEKDRKFLVGFGVLVEKYSKLKESVKPQDDDAVHIIKDKNGNTLSTIKYKNAYKNEYTIQSDIEGQITYFKFDSATKTFKEYYDKSEGIWNIEEEDSAINNSITIEAKTIISGQYSRLNFVNLVPESAKVIKEGNAVIIKGKNIFGNNIAYKINDFLKLKNVVFFGFSCGKKEVFDFYSLELAYKNAPTLAFVTKEELKNNLVHFNAKKILENTYEMSIYNNFEGEQKQGFLELDGFKLAKDPFKLIDATERDKMRYRSSKDLQISVIDKQTDEEKTIFIRGYISDIPDNYRDNITIRFNEKSVPMNIPQNASNEIEVVKFIKKRSAEHEPETPKLTPAEQEMLHVSFPSSRPKTREEYFIDYKNRLDEINSLNSGEFCQSMINNNERFKRKSKCSTLEEKTRLTEEANKYYLPLIAENNSELIAENNPDNNLPESETSNLKRILIKRSINRNDTFVQGQPAFLVNNQMLAQAEDHVNIQIPPLEAQPVASSASSNTGIIQSAVKFFQNIVSGSPAKLNRPNDAIDENMDVAQNFNKLPDIKTHTSSAAKPQEIFPIGGKKECMEVGVLKGDLNYRIQLCSTDNGANGDGRLDIEYTDFNHTSFTGYQVDIKNRKIELEPKHHLAEYKIRDLALTLDEHFGYDNGNYDGGQDSNVCLNKNICTAHLKIENSKTQETYSALLPLSKQVATSFVNQIFNSKVLSTAIQTCSDIYAPIYAITGFEAERIALKCGISNVAAKEVGGYVATAIPSILSLYANPVAGAWGIGQSVVISKITKLIVETVKSKFETEEGRGSIFEEVGRNLDQACGDAVKFAANKMIEHLPAQASMLGNAFKKSEDAICTGLNGSSAREKNVKNIVPNAPPCK